MVANSGDPPRESMVSLLLIQRWKCFHTPIGKRMDLKPYPFIKIFQVLKVLVESRGTLTKPDKSQELHHKIIFGMLSTKRLEVPETRRGCHNHIQALS